MGALRQDDAWVVRPSDSEGIDSIFYGGIRVGQIMWARELRYPSICRKRMSDGLNAVEAGAIDGPFRHTWSASLSSRNDAMWTLEHNGVEVGELLWSSKTDRPILGILLGLNMVAGGRHPVACEPMPVTRPHLRLVR